MRRAALSKAVPTAASELAEDMFVLDKIAGSDDVDDMLQGGGSDDTMTGGTGADTFVFAAATTATTAIPRDTKGLEDRLPRPGQRPPGAH